MRAAPRVAAGVVIGPDAGPCDGPRRLYAALGFVPVCVTRSCLGDPLAGRTP